MFIELLISSAKAWNGSKTNWRGNKLQQVFQKNQKAKILHRHKPTQVVQILLDSFGVKLSAHFLWMSLPWCDPCSYWPVPFPNSRHVSHRATVAASQKELCVWPVAVCFSAFWIHQQCKHTPTHTVYSSVTGFIHQRPFTVVVSVNLEFGIMNIKTFTSNAEM